MGNSRIYLIATVLAIGVLLTNQAFIQFFLFQKREDSRLINLSGRQRMLSQRLVNVVLLRNEHPSVQSATEAEEVFQTWERSHEEIIESLQSFFFASEYEEIRRQLTALTPFIERTKGYLNQRGEIPEADLVSFIANQEDFLLKMDEIVGGMEIYSQRKLFRIIWIEIVLALLSLALIYYEITFIFRRINRDLEQKNRFLKESNELLEQYAYLAAHDLKSPAQTILSFAELMKKRLSGKLEQSELEYLEFISQAAERMQMTTSDLLQFATINQDKLKIIRLQPREVVQAVLDDMQELIQQSEAEIHIGELPEYIYGDKHMLYLVFYNLIGNAVKFTKKGEKPEVRIDYEQFKNNHLFSIQDKGIGIPTEKQTLIFGLFKRLHSHATYAGTGIGLAICKKILEKHQGDIFVKSKPDEGSTFQISIPMTLLAT